MDKATGRGIIMADTGLQELEHSEHFKAIHKQQLEQPAQPQQISQPATASNGIVGIIETVTRALENPATRALIVANPATITAIIDEYSAYKPIIYSFLQSKYPDIFQALQQVQVPEQTEETEPEDIEKPVPREAINYEMIELSKEGYNCSEIAEILSEKYNITVYAMNVGKQLKRLQQAAQDKARANIGNIPKAIPSQQTISKRKSVV